MNKNDFWSYFWNFAQITLNIFVCNSDFLFLTQLFLWIIILSMKLKTERGDYKWEK